MNESSAAGRTQHPTAPQGTTIPVRFGRDVARSLAKLRREARELYDLVISARAEIERNVEQALENGIELRSIQSIRRVWTSVKGTRMLIDVQGDCAIIEAFAFKLHLS